jgi:carboxymethylenebutenolidase
MSSPILNDSGIDQEMIRLTAADGFELDAWRATPAGKPKGAIVIAQEMYGVTDYLKRVTAFYASQGYLAITPALYDRRERGTVLAYNEADRDRVHELYKSMDWELSLTDLEAGRRFVASAGPDLSLKTAIIGFCWGGSLAWMAACRYDYQAAVAYYGSAMPDYAGETPRCPVIAHVGDSDSSFPPPRVAAFKAVQPGVPVYTYPDTPHGFDNETRRARYRPEAHRLARERTLAFLAQYIS